MAVRCSLDLWWRGLDWAPEYDYLCGVVHNDSSSRADRTPRRDVAARRRAVRELIAGGAIGSQEQLLRHLAASGLSTTQATLSRDLKVLKVGKLPDGRGGYSYAFRDQLDQAGSAASLQAVFLHGFRSLAFSGNLAVVHTLPGHAASVAFALDKLQVEGIIGTVAGDDTILAVLAEGTTPAAARRALRRCIPELGGAG